MDKGRIGLDISPANPDIIYAIVEAADGKGGVFRSTTGGESWEKRSDYMSSSPQYYNELVCHPTDPDTVYSLDTFMHVSRDGGKTFARAPRKNRHVDDHALWINPDNPLHMVVGSDGGVYETFDDMENWRFVENMPITQFYRVAVDNALPFYNVYGGTQDNSTLGGPSRTINPAGILNEDWYVVVGGDGFEPAIDPTDPNIVYGQWQYGNLVRHNRLTKETVDIKPREQEGEAPNVWNWDSPLLISPHSHTRLYFCSDRVHRSDDRGDSWMVVSPDLTRQIDRNQLEVMGEIQKPDAVSKHRSTSIYGNIVAFDESPIEEGLLYVGTDDGLIHMTANGGADWQQIEQIDDIPELVYVSCVRASRHDADRVYVTFDNHKNGDFRPHVFRSDDRGLTWTSIIGDLPEGDTVYSIVEDDENEDLLFVGTEFSAYFTLDGGESWLEVPGLPTIAVRDIDIQRREGDLVMATFGRGFYVLDDYTPLREMSEELLSAEAHLFEPRRTWRYHEWSAYGGRDGRGWQGASMYGAPNPPFGAVFTYSLGEKITTRKERRQEAEKAEVWNYPTIEEFRAEDREKEPRVWLIVRDSAGDVVRRISGPRSAGVHRVAWDLHVPSSDPVSLATRTYEPWESPPRGPMAAPGTYTVSLAKEVDGEITPMSEPRTFEVVDVPALQDEGLDRDRIAKQMQWAMTLHLAAQGTMRTAQDVESRLNHLRVAAVEAAGVDDAMLARVDAARAELDELLVALRGDPTLSRREEPQDPTILGRVRTVTGWLVGMTSPMTTTQREQVLIASEQLEPVVKSLNAMIDGELAAIEGAMDDAGAPWTPGRRPSWDHEAFERGE